MHPTAHLIVANGRISDLMVEADHRRVGNALELARTTPPTNPFGRIAVRIGRTARRFGEALHMRGTASA